MDLKSKKTQKYYFVRLSYNFQTGDNIFRDTAGVGAINLGCGLMYAFGLGCLLTPEISVEGEITTHAGNINWGGKEIRESFNQELNYELYQTSLNLNTTTVINIM